MSCCFSAAAAENFAARLAAIWIVSSFFSILARRLLKHGHFDTPEDLAEQMLAFVETHNQTATPFRWTYTGKVLGA